MIELLNWRDKGFFGKKENISIHELADKGAEWGLFLSDSNTGVIILLTAIVFKFVECVLRVINR